MTDGHWSRLRKEEHIPRDRGSREVESSNVRHRCRLPLESGNAELFDGDQTRCDSMKVRRNPFQAFTHASQVRSAEVKNLNDWKNTLLDNSQTRSEDGVGTIGKRAAGSAAVRILSGQLNTLSPGTSEVQRDRTCLR